MMALRYRMSRKDCLITAVMTGSQAAAGPACLRACLGRMHVGVNKARAHESSLLQRGMDYSVHWVSSQSLQPSQHTARLAVFQVIIFIQSSKRYTLVLE